MKRMRAFDFQVMKIPYPPKLFCKFITITDDSITLFGNSVEEIFLQCKQKFPEGLGSARGIIFSGENNVESRKNLSEFLTLGYECGYFKTYPTQDRESNDGNESK